MVDCLWLETVSYVTLSLTRKDDAIPNDFWCNTAEEVASHTKIDLCFWLLATTVELLATTVELLATTVELLATTVELLATAVELLATAVELLATTVELLATAVELLATAVELLATTVVSTLATVNFVNQNLMIIQISLKFSSKNISLLEEKTLFWDTAMFLEPQNIQFCKKTCTVAITQPRFLFGRCQWKTSSVTDDVLRVQPFLSFIF